MKKAEDLVINVNVKFLILAVIMALCAAMLSK